jgi:hypothetical protein
MRDAYFSIENFQTIELSDSLDNLLNNESVSSLLETLSKEVHFLDGASSADISFPFRYGFLKPVSTDSSGSKELEIDFLKWQTKQVSPSIDSSHTLLHPAHYSHNNERLILAIQKKCIRYASTLLKKLEIPLQQVSFTMLNAIHYLETHQHIKRENDFIFVHVSNEYVEYASQLEGILKEAHTLYPEDTSNAQSVGIELRQALDYILSDSYRFKLSKIFLFGSMIDKSYAKQLSDMLATPIEILNNSGDIDWKADSDVAESLHALFVSSNLNEG